MFQGETPLAYMSKGGLPAMLRKKLKYDPEARFQSEWYRWYRDLFTVPAAAPARR